MLNGTLELIRNLDPIWIYAFAVLITFGENIFPPFPGDVILIFCGYLSGLGRVHWLILLVFAYCGSIVGFMILHSIGRALDYHVIQSRKLRWLPYGAIEKVEQWFHRHGTIIILINRFLMGVRSAIALFSGMARIDRRVTFIFASISLMLWNAILILSGKFLGDNWKVILSVLYHYRRVLTVVIIAALLVLLLRYLWILLRRLTTS
jgi:membrane protein DedA with SNARE-associated domain